MKQLLQYVRTGETAVVDVPTPIPGPTQLLVRVGASLVSAGTERTVVDFAQKNLLAKARSRPDLVRQTLDKARRDGILSTFEAVQNRLEQPLALGYSCAGTVIAVGAEVAGFAPGDRVACAGGGYAVHAEIVAVPQTLVARLPDGVSDEAAAFTTLGAIALQGVRLADVKLGETVAVIGLGLLGQLTVQLLKAAGCAVIGTDPQQRRVELALRLGADEAAAGSEEFAALCLQHTAGRGVDAVLITADTRSNQPVELAGEVARDKGVVVAVGAVGTAVPRRSYYAKELDFRISRSYGPGRYDPSYEDEGRDYPYAYVRWTEQRNMEAVVGLMAAGRLAVEPLISHRFTIDEAPQAYELITGKGEPFLGVLLTYPTAAEPSPVVELAPRPAAPDRSATTAATGMVRLGLIGAGTYASATLLPAIKGIANLERVAVASARGVTARVAAERFGFAYCATDARAILDDPAVNTVAILTRHNLHARQTIDALVAGKHVFVEKPLCLTEQELAAIEVAYNAARSRAAAEGRAAPALMVGFNRRFAPMILALKEQLAGVREPLMLTCRVNAGYIPPDHWTQDPAVGGGRLIGEACHFIDLLIFLAGARVARVTTRALPDGGRYRQDNLLITLEFEEGSIGQIVYVANGDKSFGKEALELFGGGLAARLDDYRSLSIRRGATRIARAARLGTDKGHRATWQAFVAHLLGQAPPPIAFADLLHSTAVTLAAQRSLAQRSAIELA